VLQARRSRFQVLVRWILWIYQNFPSTLWPCWWISLWQKFVKQSSRGVNGSRRVKLTNLPPFVSQISRENVGGAMSHNTMDFRRLLQV
jgi:hypothetical protein